MGISGRGTSPLSPLRTPLIVYTGLPGGSTVTVQDVLVSKPRTLTAWHQYSPESLALARTIVSELPRLYTQLINIHVVRIILSTKLVPHTHSTPSLRVTPFEFRDEPDIS